MASIRSRGEGGCLFFDFRFQGVRCREQTLLNDTVVNRRKLQAVLNRIEKLIKEGTFNYRDFFPNSPMAERFDKDSSLDDSSNQTPLFKNFCEEWFDENVIRWKESYVKLIRITLDKYLIPMFGDQAVGNITKASILKFRASLAKANLGNQETTLSNDRINHIMTPLRMILDEAADRFEFNTPYRNIKALQVVHKDIEPFSLHEVHKILANVRADYRDYFLVRFFTGLRTAEIDGLQWKYIDLDNRCILVRETVVQGKISSTKTPESRRTVQMSQPVYETFIRLTANKKKNAKFVFSNSKGNPLNHRNVTQRVWYPLLEELDLPRRNPYQTRHTAASLWLAAGESPEWIARQMGHTTTRMLFTVYSQYVPNLTRNDGSAMDSLLTAQGFNDDVTL